MFELGTDSRNTVSNNSPPIPILEISSESICLINILTSRCQNSELRITSEELPSDDAIKPIPTGKLLKIYSRPNFLEIEKIEGKILKTAVRKIHTE